MEIRHEELFLSRQAEDGGRLKRYKVAPLWNFECDEDRGGDSPDGTNSLARRAPFLKNIFGVVDPVFHKGKTRSLELVEAVESLAVISLRRERIF